MTKNACIFCDIINRKAAGSIVYEDELVIAFHDAFPLNPGHILVVPKVHAKDIAEIDEKSLWRMSSVAQDLAKSLLGVASLACTGVNLLMANGSSAGQEVMHAHLHVIPRRDGDGIRVSGPGKVKAMPREQMNHYAAHIHDMFAKKSISEQVVLRTDRLLLRPFTLSDADDVQRLAGDYDIASTTSTIPHPYPDGVAEEWIRSHRSNLAGGKAVNFAIVRHDDSALIGSIGLLNMKQRDLQAELGCWIGKPFWGAGYATEATRAVLRYGFESLGLNRIQACHMTRNHASGRIFEKLGMTKEGVLRQAIRKFDAFEDSAVYGLLRTEYEAAGLG